MTGASQGILRYIGRGELVHRQSFAVLLAERITSTADAIDTLLDEADAGADQHLMGADAPNLETLGLLG
jgi:hypothetical protein